jgi:Arc/MetJ-type ribon-helix-helix transcriptional regulator
MSGTVLTTRFSKKDIETMENLIKSGYFESKSDLIRHSVRHFIEEKTFSIPLLIKKNAIQADKLGITHRELIKKARTIGAKVYEEEYGDN